MNKIIILATKASRARIFLKALIIILLSYFYYWGFQKYLALSSFHMWLLHAPVTKSFAGLLSFAIPATQLLVAGMLLIEKTRIMALYVIVTMQLLYVAWVSYVVFATPYLIWPWRPLLFQANWFYLLIQVLTVAWLALISIRMQKILSKSGIRLF